MSTLVCFHAHPDDESTSTAGTMARASSEGHRVVMVVATRGERGEPTEGVLEPDEQLWQRRIVETYESARILGVQRVEFLGYVDSGMIGEADNDYPYAFWQANVEQAANRLAAILWEEDADVLTTYDDGGGYGHPDHIQVHRVGARAAEIASTPKVLQATMNRDEIVRSVQRIRGELLESGQQAPEGAPDMDDLDRASFGKPERELTHAIDVSNLLNLKRLSMQAHRSQIGDDSWFMQLDDRSYGLAFGTEWYIDSARPRGEGGSFQMSIWS